MAEAKVISKEHVFEEGKVVITETVEKKLSLEELQREINQYRVQQQGIIRQVESLKKQYELLEQNAAEVQRIIDSVDTSFPDF
ncbi:Ribonuclease G/E [Paenibacillus sp. LBL]|uniref:hypothetical protein n=1 Tax=Paenibacillus sp. LBL TaxID=2940563 RepID=UPI002474977B|nr:hypothetical protein [Paenibacillus sp. LBL]MDH6670160.1 Ribonuclease G/E [Paenibacillus sp. LBL]